MDQQGAKTIKWLSQNLALGDSLIITVIDTPNSSEPIASEDFDEHLTLQEGKLRSYWRLKSELEHAGLI
jgi:hypothetical protein